MPKLDVTRVKPFLKISALVVWVIVVIICVGLYVHAVPLRFAELSQAGGAGRGVHQLTLEQVRLFEKAGISTTVYAFYNLIFEILQATLFVGAGLLIFWRRPMERMAWFVSLLLVTMGVGYPATSDVFQDRWAITILGMGPALALIFLYVFPTGRFAPRWSAWLAVVSAGYALALAFSGQRLLSWPTPVHILATVACFTPGIAIQVVRFRRTAKKVERLQTEWVVYAIVVTFLALATNAFVRLLLRAFDNPPVWHLAFNIVVAVPFLETLLPAFVPVSIALSVLRFRLWDIKLIVNRSLVYLILSVVLALIFSLVIWGLQVVFVTWLGLRQTWLPLLISLALTVVLYHPLYQRVRALVDQRIYGFRFSLDEVEAALRCPTIKNPGALSGSVIGGYQVLDLLGKGGMGEVYRGEGDGRSVAIKILPEGIALDDDFCKRMKREAQVLALLDHPNIVRFYGCGEHQGRYYLVLDLVDGQNLRACLAERGVFSLEDLQPIVRKLADALNYTHTHGVIHRDVKPSNIMLRADDREPVLMDFGIALQEQEKLAEAPDLLAGTVAYMAPEQILMSKAIDQRADVYSLGVMLFELLTGKCPYQGDISRVIFGHLQQPPPDLLHYRPDLPVNTALVMHKALAKNPRDRFDSVAEMVNALYN